MLRLHCGGAQQRRFAVATAHARWAPGQKKETVHCWAALVQTGRRQRCGGCCASLDEYATASSLPESEWSPAAPFLDADLLADAESSSDSAQQVAVALAKVAWDTKGEDILVLDVRAQASWCSYMVFVTVFSRPQLNAILGKMEKEARDVFGRTPRPGGGRSAWEVLDLEDVVVHVFGAELREYYNLEKFYSDADVVDLPFLTEPSRPADIEWQTTQR